MLVPLATRPAGIAMRAPARSWARSSFLKLNTGRVASSRPARILTSTRVEAGEGAEILYEATGVPLFDEMMALPHVESAAQHSAKLVSLTVVGVAVGMLVLHLLDKKATQREGQARGEGVASKDFNVIVAVAFSIIKPAKKLLPVYGIAYASTVLLALTEVAATKLDAEFKALTFGFGGEVLKILKFVTQLVQVIHSFSVIDLSELVLIIMATWSAIHFKNRMLAWDAAANLLRPVSGVLNALILLAAGATTLSSFGINIGPLMASVGGIGVVVGLVSQSLMGNVAAAILLYSSRPFIVGDRIQLQTGADLVVEGLVIDIEPVRIVIRDDDGNTVFINNSEVATYIVKNMGRKGEVTRSVDSAPQASA